ncbi:MAG: aspartate aminotransferase family protein [Faecalibacterium sp.]|nr:aspartate aminotransferase family protein [Ruminococcus sp.]MCM1391269.1 aspartate aminotransferase family protein [Ruminococcus sp.]MCM1484757.1 aspartate aminotransferase family protein [Faecalibacterium sp.]
MDTKNLDSKYVAHTYARFPVEITGGKGAVITDENGKEYIDMGSGIAVNTFGMADEEWISAVTAQLGKFQHTSNLYYTKPCAELAELICEKTGMSKVFFSNSGAEANECAIKLARAHGEKKGGKDCYTIITLKNSFHGRTLATLAATGQDVFHQKFTPLPDGFVFADAGDIDSVKKLAEENNCCAIMMELVQGEGGVNVLSPEFVSAVAEFAKQNDLLLIIDEVQTGNGRTGKLYSYMHYDIKPDVFTTAKGLGGGLPIGACVMGDKAADLLGNGDHGSTFGGNPVVCAGAVNIINRLTDDFLAEVAKKGEYLKSKLLELEGVKEVSGKGLMLGVLAEKESKQIIAQARENGLLVLSAKSKVRLLPPLSITTEQIDKAVGILNKCINS